MWECAGGAVSGGWGVDRACHREGGGLKEAEGGNCDRLIVSEGEIKPPDESLIANLSEAKEEMGLKVHGLRVGDAGNAEVVESICTHVHAFKSWTAVGGKPS